MGFLANSAYLQPEREKTKKDSIYLDDNLRPQGKIEAPTGRAVLNYTQWFILVTFKVNIPKGEVHELGD